MLQYLSVCRSACQSVRLSFHPSIHLPTHPPMNPCIDLSLHLTLYPPMPSPVIPSFCLFVFVFTCWTVNLFHPSHLSISNPPKHPDSFHHTHPAICALIRLLAVMSVLSFLPSCVSCLLCFPVFSFRPIMSPLYFRLSVYLYVRPSSFQSLFISLFYNWLHTIIY